ncbi:MAG: low molecular weight phosphatase family protein [Desulfobacteraceae bacterium IS3]|nr:MAG: low molecular weight phosphatase family protein [Desulfobacteraceae bacterium IS3]HAO19724.1 arsenate reductase ArsC [Desulfobacteraceae bacterium]
MDDKITVKKIRVLFVCIHNSARSQIAEAYVRQLGGDRFEAESAGFEPGKLNPLVVEVMKEAEIDISDHKTKSVFEFFKQGRLYDYVITVCDESSGQQCPIFPGIVKRIHWSFPDPSSFDGTYEEKLAQTRNVRDQIRKAVENLIKEAV